MAIRIDIPGIGPVEVEGIASEETLQRLAAALEKSSGGLAKDQDNQSKALKQATKEITGHSTGWVAAADNLTQSFKNLALTATSVATKFFANYDSIAANPIRAGQALLNTAIDITANFVGGLAGSVPVIGGFLKGITDATAALAKMANDAFADQLVKNIEALQIYAKSGISFSGGMTAMQNAAQSAGLGIKDFASGVSKAKNDLDYLGKSGGDAAQFLGERIGLTAKLIGKSGQSLRNEMLALGYSYDDQVEIMASYMANMKQAGKLEKMTSEEVALATRDYARDLKVIADLTGKDAKKLQDRARQQQLLVAVQQQLSAGEIEGLGNATTALNQLGDASEDATLSLTQRMLKRGTNVQGFTMGPGKDVVDKVLAAIKAGKTDLASLTQVVNDAKFAAQQRLGPGGDKMQGGMSAASIMGAGGPVNDAFAKVAKGIMSSGKMEADQAVKSKKQAEDQMTATDDLTKGMQVAYDAGQKFKVAIEGFLNSHLDVYAKTLAGTFKEVTDELLKFLGRHDKTISENRQYDLNAQKIRNQANPFVPGQDFAPSGEELNEWAMKHKKKHDKGGRIGSGDIGIAGERGPELISGPSSVLSRASTEKLITALDAMKEKKGVRFADNGFQRGVSIDSNIVGTTESYAEIVNKRTSGFEGLSDTDLQREIQSRPEYADMQRAKNAMDDEMGMGKSDTSAKIDQTNSLLSELVTAMKQNVNQTARVAMNTN